MLDDELMGTAGEPTVEIIGDRTPRELEILKRISDIDNTNLDLLEERQDLEIELMAIQKLKQEGKDVP